MASQKRQGRQPTAWLTVARIVKTQGRRGEVAAEILTDFPQQLARRRQLWLWDGRRQPQPATLDRVWPHKNYLVFHFAGVTSLSQAEELLGLEIQIPRAEAAPTEGAFYLHELVGCRVVEPDGSELGRVREVLTTPGAPLLAVEAPGGKELLIPFAEEICRRIAPEEDRIEVILPEGLRHLND